MKRQKNNNKEMLKVQALKAKDVKIEMHDFTYKSYLSLNIYVLKEVKNG